ncbi:Chlorovirus glycoprotein repeat domain-containing protein [Acanthocystis turfacea Chlorella virus MN0810.1]|nr:Chlorovirus glycoprotein repeat domain-containing protein [Acanthocystis turfacea Chlorella virus MN0810.1]
MSSSQFKQYLLQYMGVNTDARVMNFPGTITATGFNGSSSNVVPQFPQVAPVDIQGNIISGEFANVYNINVSGDLMSAGNIYSAGLNGNGYFLDLNGYTIIPKGNVPNTVARLQYTGPIGSLITEEDTANSYLLVGEPPTFQGNWNLFGAPGSAFNADTTISVFGRTGNVVAQIGDYNANQVTLSAIIGSVPIGNGVMEGLTYLEGDKANITPSGNIYANFRNVFDVIAKGNVDAANVTARDIVVNGNLAIGGSATIANISGRFFGNVAAAGNATASNVMTSTLSAPTLAVSGQVDVLGNVIADKFIVTGALSGNVAAPYFLGNVDAQGNVDAGNVTTNSYFAYGAGTLGGQVNVLGNVVANNFVGTVRLNGGNISAPYFLGNVNSPGNVDAANLTAGYLNIPGNVVVTGQVNLGGGLFASNLFAGDATFLGNVSAPYFPGNVQAEGNVDAANVTATGPLTVKGSISAGGQVNVLGNVIADNFIGNVVLSGNISAPYFIGNVISKGNVDAFRVLTRNFTAGTATFNRLTRMTGNIYTTRLQGGTLFPTANITAEYFFGNVDAAANVDAANVTANSLLVFGNAVVAGQINVTGNVVAHNYIGGLSVNGNVSAGYFLGNVISKGNVDAVNVTTTMLSVAGNTVVTGQVNVLGNVTADNFVGRFVLSGNVAAKYFLGNVIAKGDVNAGNVTTTGPLLVYGNVGVLGEANVIGNVVANIFVAEDVFALGNITAQNFLGNVNAIAYDSQAKTFNTGKLDAFQDFNGRGNMVVLGSVTGDDLLGTVYDTGSFSSRYFFGKNVISLGNVDAANVTTKGPLYVYGNVTVAGQVDAFSNVYASYFVGNASLVGNADAKFIVGNVDSKGNVDAANVSVGLLRVNGNVVVSGEVYMPGTVLVANTFNATGFGPNSNLSATMFVGNLLCKGNVDAGNVSVDFITVRGSDSDADSFNNAQVNVRGEVVAERFDANNSMITANINVARNFFGNVTSSANVIAANVTATNVNAFGRYSLVGNTEFLIDEGMIATSNVIVGGNNVIGSGAVISKNTPFVWTGTINDDPTTDALVPAAFYNFGTVGSYAANYVNPTKGVQFSIATIQSTSTAVAWSTKTIDFSRDFRIRWTVESNGSSTTGGTGLYIMIGGSTPGSINNIYTNNFSLGFRYNWAGQQGSTEWACQGSQFGSTIAYRPSIFYPADNMMSKPFTSTIEVRTIRGRRYAFAYTGWLFNVADNAADVTAWSPIGPYSGSNRYITVGATNGPSAAQSGDQYLRYIDFTYL